MSFNSSSSLNPSLLPPLLSSNSSSNLVLHFCFKYQSSFLTFTTFSITNIVIVLPLCTFVVYLGLQRWRKRGSTAASHSDVFTYHMVGMETINIFGCGIYICGNFIGLPFLMVVGLSIVSVGSNGQLPFHILTCVERHLAVVHPITYLKLRERGGVRIRNVTTVCVWLVFVGLYGVSFLSTSTVHLFCVSVLAMVIVTFCSLSVLRTLIRPGPGEQGGDRERVDQSKRRAFHTIMAIMGVLLLRFGGHLLVLSVYSCQDVSERVRCWVVFSGVWFSLPSSLVLPLLFLHRAGKLLCCKNNTESGQGSE